MNEFEDEEPGGGASFKINTKYKDKMEASRRVEEQMRLRDRYGQDFSEEDLDSSASSTDDEAIVNPKLAYKKNLDFLKCLAKIRGKDDTIYDKNTKFFEASSEDSTVEKKEKKEKKLTLREYEMKQGDRFEEDESVEETVKSETYNEEQARLKRAFHSSDDGSDDGEDDMLVKKVKTDDALKKEKSEFAAWMRGQKKQGVAEDSDLKSLRKTWKDGKISADEQFLRDYFLDQKWRAASENEGSESSQSEGGESSESDDFLTKKEPSKAPDTRFKKFDSSDSEADVDFLKKQEKFEIQEALHSRIASEYQYHHEEPGAAKIQAVPRRVDDSIKQNIEDEAKKSKRKVQKEKDDAAKKQRMDDLKLQKRLKEDELADKLAMITQGEELQGLDELGVDLDKDWNAEEYDQMMDKLFGNQYYDQIGDGDEKPTWDDDLMHETLEDPDEIPEENFGKESRAERRKRERTERRKRKNKNATTDTPPVKPGQPSTSEVRSKAELLAETNPEIKEKLDELTKLETQVEGQDFFKYRKTEPNNFGLTGMQILMADDKDLNKWASFAKVVAQRDSEIEKKERDYFARQMDVNQYRVRRVLMSLYQDEAPSSSDEEVQVEAKSKKKRKKKKKTVVEEGSGEENENIEVAGKNSEDAKSDADVEESAEPPKKKKKKKKAREINLMIGQNYDKAKAEIEASNKSDKAKKMQSSEEENDDEKDVEKADCEKRQRPKKYKVTQKRLEAYGIKNADAFHKKLATHKEGGGKKKRKRKGKKKKVAGEGGDD